MAAFRLWRNGVGTSVWTDVVAISNHFSSTPQNRVGNAATYLENNAPDVVIEGFGVVFVR